MVASDGLYAAAIRRDQALGIPPEGGQDSKRLRRETFLVGLLFCLMVCLGRIVEKGFEKSA